MSGPGPDVPRGHPRSPAPPDTGPRRARRHPGYPPGLRLGRGSPGGPGRPWVDTPTLRGRFGGTLHCARVGRASVGQGLGPRPGVRQAPAGAASTEPLNLRGCLRTLTGNLPRIAAPSHTYAGHRPGYRRAPPIEPAFGPAPWGTRLGPPTRGPPRQLSGRGYPAPGLLVRPSWACRCQPGDGRTFPRRLGRRGGYKPRLTRPPVPGYPGVVSTYPVTPVTPNVTHALRGPFRPSRTTVATAPHWEAYPGTPLKASDP